MNEGQANFVRLYIVEFSTLLGVFISREYKGCYALILGFLDYWLFYIFKECFFVS